jgi:hypothetical protein
MDNLQWEFKSLGEIYWAYDFLKNVEKCSPKDLVLIRLEKALKENLEVLNNNRTFQKDYLQKSVITYIGQRWGRGENE